MPSIFSDELGKRISLKLKKDQRSGEWTWYQDNNDTGVSGRTKTEAIRNARLAWRSWDFKMGKTSPNPVPRGKWVKASAVRITKAGKVEVKVPGRKKR